MKLPISWIVSILLLSCAARASAQDSRQTCPVTLDHIELSYMHDGGQSRPQLRVGLNNKSSKQAATITLSLSMLDSQGYPQRYPEDLTFQSGLEPGKKKLFARNLEPGSVDMHRTGESAFVEKVEFADGSNWNDDGSESCAIALDYHPK